MVRLFIKHNPVEAPVLKVESVGVTVAFQVPRSYVKGIECKYICFVEKGVCYAARAMLRSNYGQVITFYCKPMEDQPCVQEMILTDMVLS